LFTPDRVGPYYGALFRCQRHGFVENGGGDYRFPELVQGSGLPDLCRILNGQVQLLANPHGNLCNSLSTAMHLGAVGQIHRSFYRFERVREQG
jgi:hypothetical protein